MADKNEIAESFVDEYRRMGDGEKQEFARVVSKFLNETFILKNKKMDAYDFYFVQERKALFASYFALTDYVLEFDQERGFFYLATDEDRSRVRLNKFETVLLLILRLKYYENSKTASSPEDNAIGVEELVEKVNQTNIFHPIKRMTEYDLALKKLRRSKILDFKGSKLEASTRMVILPTILVVMGQSDIDLIAAELAAYSKKEEGGKG
ncbi:MAG TPA: hypothetical protein DEA63_05505, partial [Firmicutes bacterium]|nr:hypothetical protein [Bacillota bacterium]